MVTAREILIYLCVAYNGNWGEIFDMISLKKAKYEDDDVKKVIADLKCKVVTILDEEYPEWLKHVFKPPFCLFYHGDISLISDYKKCLSVIGSRNCSEYGKSMIRKIVNELNNQYVIISGMAKGIDGEAHRSAIQNGGRTVAILGTGINNPYPKENIDIYEECKEKHLVLSEHYIKKEITPNDFPLRNRIIVALSKGLLVGEAYERSGSLSSITWALNENREVMCVPYPGNVKSECNRMIKEGAALVESGSDVIDVLQ